jgi:lipid-binding SYLF domain-containing protein
MSCRHNAQWRAPVFMQVGKGSWGLQIGAQSIDLVLLVMNARGMEKLLGNKVSLGAEALIARRDCLRASTLLWRCRQARCR